MDHCFGINQVTAVLRFGTVELEVLARVIRDSYLNKDLAK